MAGLVMCACRQGSPGHCCAVVEVDATAAGELVSRPAWGQHLSGVAHSGGARRNMWSGSAIQTYSSAGWEQPGRSGGQKQPSARCKARRGPSRVSGLGQAAAAGRVQGDRCRHVGSLTRAVHGSLTRDAVGLKPVLEGKGAVQHREPLQWAPRGRWPSGTHARADTWLPRCCHLLHPACLQYFLVLCRRWGHDDGGDLGHPVVCLAAAREKVQGRQAVEAST